MNRICKHCGLTFDNCYCDRTQHVYDAKTGGCSLCGEKFKPNGTGPSNNKVIHFMINMFWFNRWVTEISNAHDIGYFEGFNIYHKKHSDKEMLRKTKEKIAKTWYLRPKSFWNKRAELNHLAVSKAGDDSFNWSGCNGIKK